MSRLAAPILGLLLLPLAALAQESDTRPAPDPEPPRESGRSLMERGAELFFDGLRDEMAPAIEELRGLADEYGPAMRSFMAEMGPALAEMFDQVKDWTAYHPPEMMPNGDIILRKRQPDAETPPPAAREEAEPMGPTDI